MDSLKALVANLRLDADRLALADRDSLTAYLLRKVSDDIEAAALADTGTLTDDELWRAWALTQGLDPNGDVAYHYAKAGWDAALRNRDYRTPSVPTLTRDQADNVAILRETLDECRNDYVAVRSETLRSVLALYPNTKETDR